MNEYNVGEFTVKVTSPNGEVTDVEVCALNQDEAHKTAAKRVFGEDVPSGTETKIVSPSGLGAWHW